VRTGIACCMAMLVLVWVGVAAADQQTHEAHGTMNQGAPTHGEHAVAQAAGGGHGGPTDEETAYSLFMHRSSGTALIVLGALVLADRLTKRRHGMFQIGIGVVWMLFGLHLFIRSDLEGWPIGQAGALGYLLTDLGVLGCFRSRGG